MSREDFEPLVWAAKGIARVEAKRWYDGGFTLNESLRWRDRFSVDEAETWRKAGVTSPSEARSWRIAGVGADEVASWRDAGIGFAEAAAWNEFGYSLEEARQRKAEGKTPSETFLRRVQKMRSTPGKRPRVLARGSATFGRTSAGPGPPEAIQQFMQKVNRKNPQVAHSYFMRQWLDDEALAWAEQGIDAADALAWKEFGISPTEAARLETAGKTPASTMRAWWAAGIPVDEVAAWLGAGLTPEEAATQRANGVSADRAAIMRALRDPGEDVT
jgi:hypothetical protein